MSANCLKRISITLTDFDKINVTMVGFEKDVNDTIEYILNRIGGTIIQESRTEKGTFVTVNVTIERRKLAGKAVVYKAIPAALKSLYDKRIIPQAMFPIDLYTSTIYIYPTPDNYGAKSETISTVLGRMGIPIVVPAQLNYKVNNVTVDSGVSIKKIIRKLFPIPGTTINSLGGILFLNVTFQQGIKNKQGEDCVISASERKLPIQLTAYGTSGEPRYVIGAQAIPDKKPCGFLMNVTSNLIGGVFSIDYYEIVKLERQEQNYYYY